MATVKVKFRASSVPGKEGTLYYHLTHQRSLRWMSTDYHVFPDEWNDKKSGIIVSNHNSRQAHLQLIQSKIDWEMKQMLRIIRDKDVEGIPYTIDDIAKEIQQLPPSQSVFAFFRQQIAQAKATWASLHYHPLNEPCGASSIMKDGTTLNVTIPISGGDIGYCRMRSSERTSPFNRQTRYCVLT